MMKNEIPVIQVLESKSYIIRLLCPRCGQLLELSSGIELRDNKDLPISMPLVCPKCGYACKSPQSAVTGIQSTGTTEEIIKDIENKIKIINYEDRMEKC